MIHADHGPITCAVGIAGHATACGTRRSVAAAIHDHSARQRGKESLANATVKFSMAQIAAIGRGFAAACDETAYRILACAIMPDHVHLVILRHAKPIEQVIRHLRSHGNIGRLSRRGTPPHPPFSGRGCLAASPLPRSAAGRALRLPRTLPLRHGC